MRIFLFSFSRRNTPLSVILLHIFDNSRVSRIKTSILCADPDSLVGGGGGGGGGQL